MGKIGIEGKNYKIVKKAGELFACDDCEEPVKVAAADVKEQGKEIKSDVRVEVLSCNTEKAEVDWKAKGRIWVEGGRPKGDVNCPAPAEVQERYRNL